MTRNALLCAQAVTLNMDGLADVAEEPDSPPPIKLMMQVADGADADRPVKLFLDVEQPTPALSPKVPEAISARVHRAWHLKQEEHLIHSGILPLEWKGNHRSRFQNDRSISPVWTWYFMPADRGVAVTISPVT